MTMATTSVLLLLPLLLLLPAGECDLQLNYYNESCPRAEEIIKEQVTQLYNKHGNTAVSWLRNIFHDCIVKSCDASLLLDTKEGIVSEKTSNRSFGMRNFKYIDTIKAALESECPLTVSCADIVALSARDGVVMLGGPHIDMKTGRLDSTESYVAELIDFIPNHNDNISLVLSRFDSIGIDVEGIVSLLGAHSVGRVHCLNIVGRLYPDIDPTMAPEYGERLRHRCPSQDPDPKAVQYARNDLETPMVLDNMYFKNILAHKGLLLIDQQLASDPRTAPFVEKMGSDNDYFHLQFSRALLLLSQNNPLTGDQGEIRKDCRYVNNNKDKRSPILSPAQSPAEGEPTVSGPSRSPGVGDARV
ncbi:LOW QUALITY PROTEIN: peroxidase 21-like [Telopea speciosissima]|uniref:LOW QUALITY PROTEIN: peroxidase 21-like n=1 Tax=Telopea speciosissima TaxID=54955 RepID=UPI001CC7250C|nr:LOW QUALITY PROTEIN: peroxidase 21-like [Telopea speciosissima]